MPRSKMEARYSSRLAARSLFRATRQAAAESSTAEREGWGLRDLAPYLRISLDQPEPIGI